MLARKVILRTLPPFRSIWPWEMILTQVLPLLCHLLIVLTEISVKDTTLLCDVISSFEAASKTWKLIIKQRIWSPTKLLPDEDPMTKRLVYTQLMEDVVNERFAVTEQEILLLAALHMQILWGNYNPSTVVISDNDLAHFIPKVSPSISI